MGCGKTTLGRDLALLMDRRFIDLDEASERAAGMPIHEIFRQQGEEAFRTTEKKVLGDVLRNAAPAVVALGGGTACDEDNLGLLLENGLLVYIRIPILTLAERLAPATATRPLLAGLTGEKLVESIEQRLLEREQFYHRAHLVVNGINLGATELFRIISRGTREGHM